MIIIFKNDNNNIFLKAQLRVCNLDFIELLDLDDLLKRKEEIKSDYVYILNKNYGFLKEFYSNLEFINNLEENVILGYNNIKTDDTTDTILTEYIPIQDNENRNKRDINFAKIKTDNIKKLEHKELKNFNDFLYDIDFKKISCKTYTSIISIHSNLVQNGNNILLKKYRNLKNLKKIDDTYKSYLNFLNNNEEEEEDIKEVRKIYNELNNNLSCFFIFDNHQEILNFLKKTDYNTDKNRIFLFSQEKFDIEGLDMKVEVNLKIDSLNQLIDTIEFDYECYFLKSINSLDKILKSNKSNILNGNDNYSMTKMDILYLKFIKFDYTNIDNYLIEFGKFIYNYLFNEMLIINEKNKPDTVDNFEIKIFKEDIIDKLYNNNFFNECCSLISFVIKHRLSTNCSYIYKIFSVLDKIDYNVKPRELKPLLDLINFSNFEEFFSLCIVMKYHNLESWMMDKIDDFFENINKKYSDEEIIKLLYVIYLFNIPQRAINISSDIKYIRFLVKNLDIISDNFKIIENIDKNANQDNIYASCLLYLNCRQELIESDDDKKNIKSKVNDFLGIDLENLKEIDEEKFLNIFKKYPLLIWNTGQSLSDFMLNTKDILKKRENLLILSNLILSNWDKLDEEIKKKKIIFNFSNFKYSYHGISNKKLFENVVNIGRKSLLNNTNKEELCNYEYQKTSKKKIGFFSNFLTRNHSVFKDRHQVIKYLSDKEDFEVYLITFEPIQFTKEIVYKNTKKILLGNQSIISYVNTIRSLKLDKLVFCEIGMDNRACYLSHFRMANKQYNTWGHSDTSGYPEIDYFVSSKLYELPYEESQKHYSEKLILQNGMCTCYVNPTAKYNLTNPRSFYGLSDYEKIILCPQSLFKIHPDFDMYIFEILLKNQDASIVLLENEKKTKIYERWDKVLKNYPKYFGVLSRVKFVPPQVHNNFVNLMKCSDVLIDPYPFGGCNSSLESFSLFKPLVTQPSIRINGRFTYGFYKKMGMDDMIANNMEEYVDITTKLLNDKEFYDKQVNLLKKRSDILFEDQETLKEWEELMSE